MSDTKAPGTREGQRIETDDAVAHGEATLHVGQHLRVRGRSILALLALASTAQLQELLLNLSAR